MEEGKNVRRRSLQAPLRIRAEGLIQGQPLRRGWHFEEPSDGREGVLGFQKAEEVSSEAEGKE